MAPCLAVDTIGNLLALAGLHFVAFAMRMAPKVAAFLALGAPATSQCNDTR